MKQSANVLENESIPLGLRRMIRKYFQLILLGQPERDAVYDSVGDELTGQLIGAGCKKD